MDMKTSKGPAVPHAGLVDRLYETGTLADEEFARLIDERTAEDAAYLFGRARERALEQFGTEVYLRGLIEVSNYCRNNCYYCGIRAANTSVKRYRMTKDVILSCCRRGHALGFRTFVLQGGEDPAFSDDDICDIVSAIRGEFPDCAITLSIGEKSRGSYQAYFDAGANRYLLRHETADAQHYGRLHPESLSLENRIRCLYDLKEIGYQVGAGMMIQAPFQTTEHLIKDLRFLQALRPEMIGIGPFIPQKDTPFRDQPAGTASLTLYMLGILRLMFPDVLLPATTALGSIEPGGREKGILAGANVIMPNLSPASARDNYTLYDGKLTAADDASRMLEDLRRSLQGIGYSVSPGRGDSPRFRAE